MNNRSFGFSVSGTKAQALQQLDGVPMQNAPAHAETVVANVRDILLTIADNVTVSITINTHIEE